MSNIRFIGCLHLGHEWMAKHRGFKNAEEYHQHLIKSWNSVVHKKDLIYILGDVTMEDHKFYHILDKLNGVKHVVLGNHDLGKHIPELLKHVKTVSGMIHYKGFWLSHAPLHPQELTHVKGNIHAHVHEMKIPYTEVSVNYWEVKKTIKSQSGVGYYNVDAHMIDYKPKTIRELMIGFH